MESNDAARGPRGAGLGRSIWVALSLLLGLGCAQAEVPDQNRLVAGAALRLTEIARSDPSAGILNFASEGARDRFNAIGQEIWQTVSPDLGWRWYFQSSLLNIAPRVIRTNQTLTAWYHPWSDTALLGLWRMTNQEPKLMDCEIVMGGVLRRAEPTTVRAWARRRQYFPVAIGVVTAESLKAVEDLGEAIATNQLPEGEADGLLRASLPFFSTVSNEIANYSGVGVMLLAAIGDITRFSAPTNVFATRLVPAMQQVHSPSNLLTVDPLAAATIKTLPRDFLTRYRTVFYANSSERAFLFLQARMDPKLCLGFLFKLDPPDDEDDGNEEGSESTSLTNFGFDDAEEEDEVPEQMYPEAHYPIKLVRADLFNLAAVYTNLYPPQGKPE